MLCNTCIIFLYFGYLNTYNLYTCNTDYVQELATKELYRCVNCEKNKL